MTRGGVRPWELFAKWCSSPIEQAHEGRVGLTPNVAVGLRRRQHYRPHPCPIKSFGSEGPFHRVVSEAEFDVTFCPFCMLSRAAASSAIACASNLKTVSTMRV